MAPAVNRSGGADVTPHMNTFTGGRPARVAAQASSVLTTSALTTSPCVAGVAVAFPQHRYSQDETIGALMTFAGPDFRRFANSSGVTARHTALPLSRYGHLSGFTEANDAWVDVALDLGGQALLAALDDARVKPADVDVVFSTTVTGLAVPTLEARLATRVGLRQDVKRIPLFGLGCVAGAAGVARVHDYLRGFPNQVAALLAVELCSLTVQRNDHSVANLVASSLFGDGAAAVVAMGAELASGRRAGPRLLASRSRTYPDTEDVLGWEIGSDGFRIVLSVEVATVVEKYVADDIRNFLGDHGLTTADVSTWVLHAAGPRVIDAVENALELPVHALDRTRDSLRDNGNLSSVSVLDVLRATMADPPPPPGSFGIMIAMGPGFSSEFVLLGW
ncbi:Alpha-pyrone synthesis polyketide synthase-like Pks11 [Mycobacterium kansasii]|uniref:Alpha-pyrone synthesis polyketide synthase-like Pks11 n=1 Tax=Mycobacterium kansasii TaxID=1768 RepID=A0A653F6H9_MYCKA|nr:polyketide synthase-like Pks10 [Mycobacterium kansasii]VAZ62097.1 Alpha-pyrone synthesis polyketide synthase-like Pks11 [Mycobacterium kansasii]VAZ68532.1 Alpha-pyrone synthesis polyketide synthase-like Pks11 [Mycobacterium kansasii]VAZ78893.1 Alpha-pyrone synthesis polyketide synthase-like Pks11 [Mycobacterium kansasii]VTP05213.1 Alpha-pyrone synthesis polyketide synthase-like Pks11 [Mycobacterium kansasii]